MRRGARRDERRKKKGRSMEIERESKGRRRLTRGTDQGKTNRETKTEE